MGTIELLKYSHSKRYYEISTEQRYAVITRTNNIVCFCLHSMGVISTLFSAIAAMLAYVTVHNYYSSYITRRTSTFELSVPLSVSSYILI